MSMRGTQMAKGALTRHAGLYRAARSTRLIGRYAARRPHEPDFAFFRRYEHSEGLFLDIGANSGQSALSFRLFQRRAPILSLEPNPYHERDLRLVSRVIRRFSYMICGAGDENRTLTLHVPVLGGIALTGEASVMPLEHDSINSLAGLSEADRAKLEIVTETIEIRRIDDLALSPAFIKIDVEGFELPVVRGLVETIERTRPVLMVETSRRFPALLDLLDGHGYDPFVYCPSSDTVSPYTGEAQNVFMLPRESR